MTKAHLRPCPRCSRHVRVSEEACPFCGNSLDASFRSAPAPVPPSRRLSRAALFAYGTGALVLAPTAFVMIACETMTAYEYGTVPLFDSGEVEQDSGTFLMEDAYGLPPVEDSGIEDADAHVEGADANDASVESTDATDSSVEDADADAGGAD